MRFYYFISMVGLLSGISAQAFTITEAATLKLADTSLVTIDQTYSIAGQSVIPVIEVTSKKSSGKSCHYQFIVSVKPLWNVQVAPETFLKIKPSVHPEFARMMRFTFEESLVKGRKCRSPLELIHSGSKFTGEFVGGEVVVTPQSKAVMKIDLQGPSVSARMKVRENGTFAFSSLSALKRVPRLEIGSRASTFTVASQKTQVR